MAQANPFFDVANNPFLNPENNPFMDPKNNPFANNELQKIFTNVEVPSFDMDGLLATQRRNLEAISAANQSAAEGIQSVFTRQTEIVKSMMEEAMGAVQKMADAGAPEDKIADQVALTKVKLEEAVANVRELSELATKSQSAAFDILNARFNESLEEAQALTKPTPAKAKPAAKK